jgi:hypothetical protein
MIRSISLVRVVERKCARSLSTAGVSLQISSGGRYDQQSKENDRIKASQAVIPKTQNVTTKIQTTAIIQVSNRSHHRIRFAKNRLEGDLRLATGSVGGDYNIEVSAHSGKLFGSGIYVLVPAATRAAHLPCTAKTRGPLE